MAKEKPSKFALNDISRLVDIMTSLPTSITKEINFSVSLQKELGKYCFQRILQDDPLQIKMEILSKDGVKLFPEAK